MDFRALLIKIQDCLSDSDRRRLHFIFGDVIPRKLRDDQSISGTLSVLESLFDRGKISEQDFGYLIQAFDGINCQIAVARLKDTGRYVSVNPTVTLSSLPDGTRIPLVSLESPVSESDSSTTAADVITAKMQKSWVSPLKNTSGCPRIPYIIVFLLVLALIVTVWWNANKETISPTKEIKTSMTSRKSPFRKQSISVAINQTSSLPTHSEHDVLLSSIIPRSIRITKFIRYPSDDTYNGETLNGSFDGHGVYTWKNGNRYEGHWTANRREGQGTWTWGSGSTTPGDVYVGEWHRDKKHGYGKYTQANEDTYEGEFKDDKRDGTGVYTRHEDGEQFNVVYKEDQLMSIIPRT